MKKKRASCQRGWYQEISVCWGSEEVSRQLCSFGVMVRGRGDAEARGGRSCGGRRSPTCKAHSLGHQADPNPRWVGKERAK